MKVYGIGFALTLLVGQSFAFIVEDVQKTLHLETTRQGDEDILRVTSDDGDLVAVIDAYPGDEYQIVKPISTEPDICYVMRLSVKEDEKEDGFKCFERVPYPTDAIDPARLADCDDRKIFQLRPKDCFQYVKRDDGVEVRQKRLARGCRTEEQLKSTCIATERYCNQYGWWWGRDTCKEWKTRCTKYHATVVTIVVCT